jgi:hypothetical protein
MHRRITITSLAFVCLVLSGESAFAASPQAIDPPGAPGVAPRVPSTDIGSQRPKEASSSAGMPSPDFQWATDAPFLFPVLSRAASLAAAPTLGGPPAPGAIEVVASTPSTETSQGPAADPSSDSPDSHHFHWAPDSPQHAEVGVNFGLLQLALGGFNVAGEIRYRRLWLEYSHGMDLKLNDLGGYSLTQTEKAQNLHINVPYTTGAGVGVTLVDQLWLGVEVKAHRFDVNAPGGPVSSYETYSVGPVLGYKLYIFKGLYANAYLRYWPNVATSLNGGQIALPGTNGTVIHSAHDWGLFANVAIGYVFNR